ncbi:hypothetical protein FGO68_gene2283 [Halteria grandinella]|uniref:Uncharacterized protein n=1 Tax=Halteria grandinella TaxID=5974 RepID=A0A8J8NHU6_HALGN|nr:hypothetical protein FGO68_gene2283 [Halteria grandinella]
MQVLCFLFIHNIMITTVELKFKTKKFKFQLCEGENLWDSVQQFCYTYSLKKYEEQIFELLYSELTNYQNQPITNTPKKNIENKSIQQLTHYCDLRSTKRNNICNQYNTQFTYSPKINKTTLNNIPPFEARLNLKQIANKNLEERHQQKKEIIYPYTPVVNNNYQLLSYSPFKERLLTKQLNHKSHCLRHQQSQEILKQKQTVNINRSFEMSEQPNILQYTNDYFFEVERKEIKQEPQFNHLIKTIKELDCLTKQIYTRIQNISIEIELYKICLQFYQRIFSTQEHRKILKIKLINYDLLDVQEIQMLEQIVKKYQLSLELEISEKQFLLLVVNLLVNSQEDGSGKNKQLIKNLIQFNPSLTAHYQQLN